MPAVISPTRIESTPHLGRVLVANTAFELGEEVLREAPLLSWPTGDWSAYIDALCEIDNDSRAAVKDMFHPNLDNPSYAVQDLRTKAEELLSSGTRPSFCDLDFVHTALMIAKLNAHSFQSGERLALFKTGSKVAHSCAPNCSYSSKSVEGMLVFRAIRPIAPGEQITMSYIGELWLKTTAARRHELIETKWFLCHCKRCDSPDPLRAMPCTTDDAHDCWVESVEEEGAGGMGKEQWRCIVSECRAVPSESEAELLKLEESALSHKLQNEVGMALVEDSKEVPQNVEEIASLLPKTNSTAIRSHILLATILRIRAEDAGETEVGKKLYLRAAEENIKAVELMQCVAASCIHSESVGEAGRGNELYQCCPQMLEAAKDLYKAGPELEGVSVAASAVCRYVPLMHLMWGKMHEDDDMMAIIDDLKRWSTA